MLKLASLEKSALPNRWFLIGCAFYLLSAVGGVDALRYLKLATAGVVDSAATVLFLALLGVLVFGESLNRYELAGMVLAVAPIGLLWRFSGREAALRADQFPQRARLRLTWSLRSLAKRPGTPPRAP